MGTLLWLLSCAAALTALGLVVRRHRRLCKAHDRPVPMVLLSEREEDQWLDPGELLEEELGAVSYDVYQCPECLLTRQFSRSLLFSGMRRCPECGRRTVARPEGQFVSARCAHCEWEGDVQPHFQASGAGLPPERSEDWSGYSPSDFGRGVEEDESPLEHMDRERRERQRASRSTPGRASSKRRRSSASRSSPRGSSPDKSGSGGRSGGGGAGSSW